MVISDKLKLRISISASVGEPKVENKSNIILSAESFKGKE
jgi:hypothetical protein